MSALILKSTAINFDLIPVTDILFRFIFEDNFINTEGKYLFEKISAIFYVSKML